MRICSSCLASALTYSGVFDKSKTSSTVDPSNRPIDLDQLEPGDVLLRFGERGAPPRYCHFGDDGEIDALLGTQTSAPCERFDADGEGGRLNHYALFRHDACAGAARVDGSDGQGDA